LFIGAFGPSGGYGFDGQLDEARVSSVVRSADWVWAEYNTVMDASFATYVMTAKPAIIAPTVTGASATGATVGGTLADNGAGAASVTVYWGDNDGGSGTWDHNGGATAGVEPGTPVTTPATGLTEGRLYFYRLLAVNGGGSTWSDATVWQSRQLAGATWYFLSVPAGYTAPENNLNSTLGTQLASGLTAGGNEMTADSIWFWNGSSFVQYWLSSADSKWKNGAGATADLTVEPGDGFWVQRVAGSTGTLTFSGQPVASASPITLASGWSVFGWPYAATTGSSSLWGFGTDGQAGNQWDLADNIVGFYNGTYFQIYLRADGKWYNRATSTETSVKLEPGRAYYYYNRSAPFSWTPTAE
jgi:hypothetical protein